LHEAGPEHGCGWFNGRRVAPGERAGSARRPARNFPNLVEFDPIPDEFDPIADEFDPIPDEFDPISDELDPILADLGSNRGSTSVNPGSISVNPGSTRSDIGTRSFRFRVQRTRD
jgi:hypothetical protein